MQQVKGPLHRRAGLFAAPADEMAGDFSSPLPFFVHSPGMRLYALMPRGAFFPLRRGMMAGLSPVPLPFFVHSPGMRLYALMPRGAFPASAGDDGRAFSGSPALFHAFPQNAIVCAYAARAVSSFAGAKEETKKSTFGPAYVYALRTKRRSGASPLDKVQWGGPGVNRGNEARPHCRSDCSTQRCRHPGG